MWIGNLMLVLLNLPLIGIWVRLLTVPYHLLFPAIVAFACIGTFSLNQNPFDVFAIAFFGILGYVLVKLGCEPAPLLLGFVLGPLLEQHLRRALIISHGDPTVFLTRPISRSSSRLPSPRSSSPSCRRFGGSGRSSSRKRSPADGWRSGTGYRIRPMSPEAAPRTDQLRDVLVEAARTQLAAVTAATKFWAGWVTAADKYAQNISDELARMDDAENGEGDLVGRLSDLTREYLRDLTELPGVAVNHFNGELEKIGQPRRRRARAAKVKE